MTNRPPSPLASDAVLTADTVIAIGTRKGLWLAQPAMGAAPTATTDEAITATPVAAPATAAAWQLSGPHFLMSEVAAVAFDHSSPGVPTVLVGVRSEHWGPGVTRSTDLGATWQEPEQGAIAFPPEAGAALARVWQLHPDPDRPGVVWAGCEPTSLWRSDDGGESFNLVRGLWEHPHRPQWEPGFGGAAVHTVLPDPGDPGHVLVAMSTGGVYRTRDGGTSWHPRNRGISAYFLPDPEPEFGQCVHKVAVDAAGMQRLYAQNHHGVYRSDDGADSWASIADGLPSDFGFVILTHPTRPGTVWVIPLEADARRVPVGGRLRVHRSTDAGQTWVEVGQGLPDGVYSVVLRDAACVLPPSDGGTGSATLVLGTRDGCVYVSVDNGDTFDLVAEHLPDVLCVRAARVSARP